MRRRRDSSELGRLATPLSAAAGAAWQRMHWWIAAMAVLYAVSGITIVHPDEVAIVLRWGRLVGAGPGLREHGPGLLFALPRPIDEVVRVKIKRVEELRVDTLMTDKLTGATLDPVQNGYALTGDQNIVHLAMTVHYRVRDPVAWEFYGPPSAAVLRAEVTAAMVQSVGEMGVDRVLANGRKALLAAATKRAQAGLDAAHSGLEIASLEVTALTPPVMVQRDFDAVQGAVIDAETAKKKAEAYAQSAIPEAQAEATRSVAQAKSDAAAALAQANGAAAAFLALEKEYRANPAMVRERLYRDAVDQAISSAGSVRWIPPPAAGGHYHGLRITMAPQTAGPPATASANSEDRVLRMLPERR